MRAAPEDDFDFPLLPQLGKLHSRIPKPTLTEALWEGSLIKGLDHMSNRNVHLCDPWPSCLTAQTDSNFRNERDERTLEGCDGLNTP